MPERHVAPAHVRMGRGDVERVAPQHERRHQRRGGKHRHVEFVLAIGGAARDGLHAVGEEQARDDQRLVHGTEMRGPRDLLAIGADREQHDPIDGCGGHSTILLPDARTISVRV